MTTQRKFIRIPMYNQGAWYDIFNDGNVENFRWLQNYGSKGARGNQKLYMVPAGHGGLGGDKSDVEYNQPGALVPPTEEMRWWEYWLKGIDNGIMKEPPVTLVHDGLRTQGSSFRGEPRVQVSELAARQSSDRLLPGRRHASIHESANCIGRQAQLQI